MRKQGLTTNDISAVIQDREGSIWIGLLGSGLARWLGYNEWQSWGEREGLSRESMWSITRDASGRLWVGTQFGLNYAEEKRRAAWCGSSQRVAGMDMIRALAAAPDGTLVDRGERRAGCRQLNPRTGEQPRVRSRRQRLNSDNVRHRDGGPAGTGVGLDARRDCSAAWRENQPDSKQIFPAGTQTGEMFHMTMDDRQGQVWAAGARGWRARRAVNGPASPSATD